MTVASLATIERWFLDTCEFCEDSLARLPGENSLYESYTEFCRRKGSAPVGIKQFARTVELLIARYYDKIFIKTRDYKGVFFKEVALREKPETFPHIHRN